MAKMTKTQRKRALAAIMQKAQKLTLHSGGSDFKLRMSTQDFLAIEKICLKYLNKL